MTPLDTFLEKNGYVNVITVQREIKRIHHTTLVAEKYKTIQTLIDKVNAARDHDVTKNMEPRDRETWNRCIMVVGDLLSESLGEIEE